MPIHPIRRVLQLFVIAGLFVVCLGCPALASQEDTPDAAQLEKQQLLQQYSYLLWQRINEVRNNPLSCLAELDITVAQAETALGDNGWIITEGLPPLAWNDQLADAASLHGEDMVERFYYSSTSPEGLGPHDRITAMDYPLDQAGETLAALAFNNYFDIAEAVDILLQNLLRDELTPGSGVPLNIFSSSYSEIGIAFKAENIEQFVGNEYVYLLVIDVAQPRLPRSWLVGVAPVDVQIAFLNKYTGFWEILPRLGAGGFQVAITEYGGELYAFDSEWDLLYTNFIYPGEEGYYVNWQ